MSVQRLVDEGPIIPLPDEDQLDEDEFADGTAIFFENGRRGRWLTCDSDHVSLLEDRR